MKAFGNELEILILSELTESNGFWNPHAVLLGGVATLQMAWICKKLLNFWSVLVIFTSDLIGKLICVWNYFRQFRNYLKKSQTQMKEIRRILWRNSEYIKRIRFSYEFSD